MTDCGEKVSNISLQDLRFSRQLAGAEDINFGFSSITQIRNGQVVVLSQINADTIPYDADNSVAEIIAKILVKYPIA